MKTSKKMPKLLKIAKNTTIIKNKMPKIRKLL